MEMADISPDSRPSSTLFVSVNHHDRIDKVKANAKLSEFLCRHYILGFAVYSIKPKTCASSVNQPAVLRNVIDSVRGDTKSLVRDENP